MRDNHNRDRPSLLTFAFLFEGSLAVIGALLAWLAEVPLAKLLWPADITLALARGLMGTLLMMPLLVILLHARWRPIARLRRLVSRFVRQLFGDAPIWQLALIALVAGLGEEVLFRGAIQPLAIRATGPLVGLVITSLLFGLAHAASPTYFWLAAGVGLYLGAIAMATGEILSAVIIHSLYDFVALTCLSHRYFVRNRH
ncbi:MAG: CPBP family intramembrane glutamic endopeptidase [Aeoliella sp.]